jgi:hypothetical protein
VQLKELAKSMFREEIARRKAVLSFVTCRKGMGKTFLHVEITPLKHRKNDPERFFAPSESKF